MGGHGRAGRLVVGVSIVSLLGGCAAASSPPPSSAPSIAPAAGAPSVPVATPAASAVTPAPTIELTGFSVRPFGVGYATNAFFAVDADRERLPPRRQSQGAALVKVAPDGSVLARWAGFDVVPGQPDTVVGIAIDPASGDVWVTDTTADAVVRLASDLTQKATVGIDRPRTRASSSARVGSRSTHRGTSSSRTWATTASRRSRPTGRSCRSGTPRAGRPRPST